MGRLIRWILRGVSLMIPYIIRVIMFTLRLCILGSISLIVGIPRATQRIADTWFSRAMAAGFPTEYDTHLFKAMWVAAFVTIVVCISVLFLVSTSLLVMIF